MKVDLDYDKSIDYIADIYKKSDQPKMDEFAEKSGYEHYELTIEDDIARLFKLLIHLTKPKQILEIGTSIGFSTTILAKAVREYGGKIVTIDNDPDVVANARKNFEREGVNDTIETMVGDAVEIVSSFEDESFDIVFQDSAKVLYHPMLDDSLRVLKKGGLFLIDDTLFPVINEGDWDEGDEGIHKFNYDLETKKVVSTILPIGEGCTVAIKL